MELSPRLEAVALRVPQGARVADVGTDHALLPVWLLQRGVVDGAIAADLRSGPLESARRTAERYGFEDRISLRLCDGLTGIAPHEVDTVVVAGMGGETIVNILEASPWSMEGETLLLLQPQSAQFELRSFLCERNCRIERETIVKEGGRFYVVLEVRGGGGETLTPGELWAGKNTNQLLRGPYLDWLIRVLGKAAAGMERAADPAGAEAQQEVLRELREMKEEWDSWQ